MAANENRYPQEFKRLFELTDSKYRTKIQQTANAFEVHRMSLYLQQKQIVKSLNDMWQREKESVHRMYETCYNNNLSNSIDRRNGGYYASTNQNMYGNIINDNRYGLDSLTPQQTPSLGSLVESLQFQVRESSMTSQQLQSQHVQLSIQSRNCNLNENYNNNYNNHNDSNIDRNNGINGNDVVSDSNITLKTNRKGATVLKVKQENLQPIQNNGSINGTISVSISSSSEHVNTENHSKRNKNNNNNIHENNAKIDYDDLESDGSSENGSSESSNINLNNNDGNINSNNENDCSIMSKSSASDTKTIRPAPPCTISPSTPAVCPVSNCQETFNSAVSFSTHLQKHGKGPEIPYQCNDCSKVFATKGSLKRHGKVHNGHSQERGKFKCLNCQKPFKSEKGLRIHKAKKHTKAKKMKSTDKFQCQICKIILNGKQQVEDHLIHTHRFSREIAHSNAEKSNPLQNQK